MEPREIKGLEIAAKLKLVRSSGNIWYVPSQSNKQEKYTVTLDDENPQCTCRDYEIRSRKCKHIFAVEYTIERESTADGQTSGETDCQLDVAQEYLNNARRSYLRASNLPALPPDMKGTILTNLAETYSLQKKVLENRKASPQLMITPVEQALEVYTEAIKLSPENVAALVATGWT